METRYDPKKLAIEATKLDVVAFDDTVEETEVLSDAIKANSKKLSTVREFGNDLYDALFKYEPKLKPANEIKSGYRHNRNIIERAMDTAEYDTLRSYTKGHDFESALATSTILKKVMDSFDEKELREMESQSDAANQLEDDIEGLQDYTDGLKNIINDSDNDEEISKAVSNIGKAQDDLKLAQGALQKAKEDIDNTSDNLGQKVRVAVREAQSVATEGIEAVSGIGSGWGMGLGSFRRMPSKTKHLIAKKLQKNKKLLEIARLLGKMKRIALTKRDQKVSKVPETITVIEIGDDLAHLVPSELALLSDEETEILFYTKLVEKRLLQYRVEGKEATGMGAIVCCIDCSGSMYGEREIWAKAVMLSLLEVAGREKRDFATIYFGSANEIHVFKVQLDLQGEERALKVLEMAEYWFGGGTDFQSPLNKAKEIIEEKEFEKADIVMITDGECDVSDDWLTGFKTWKKEKSVKVQGILIGRPVLVMKKFCDAIYSIIELLNEEENKDVHQMFGIVS